ncbi:MAG: hypothetical protein CBD28_001455 [Rhizobiales bacterium TMED168]|nr:MAG: hypothetical protein CBD28_001455 [Rhizobiales bacterium TMED168]|tara:strand:+ start:26979 stop:27791 length:813 start_codon:yes stop_codon:yes gene_type:complete
MNLPDDLRIRFLSSVVLLSIVIFSIVKGNLYFTYFLIGASLFMIFEWMRLISKQYWILRGLIASFGLVLILLLDSIGSLSVIIFFLTFLLLIIFSKLSDNNYKMSSFGFIYISLSIISIEWLRSSNDGLLSLTIILSTIFISDISAYFFGNILGGPKLFKIISPNKTLSGFISSILFGTMWFFLITLNFSSSYSIKNLYLGFGIILLSITGDLFVSFLKRKAKIKDTGIFIPGHGGFLDRADSILPIFFLMPLYSILSNTLENPSLILIG